MVLLDGKKVSDDIKNEITVEVDLMKKKQRKSAASRSNYSR
jgi:hypothetical protein